MDGFLIVVSSLCCLGWISSKIVNGTHYLSHDGDFASAVASAQ